MTTRIYVHWTTKDIARLRRAYPVMSHDELLIAFPGRTISTIKIKAQELGIRRACKRHDWHKITAEHKPAFNFMTGVIK